MNVVISCKLLCVIAGKITPEIHVSKQELVVLLGPLEAFMHSWNDWLALSGVKESCRSTICLLDISNSLLNFFLARSQVRIHKQETSVLKIKSNSYSTLVGSHTFGACLDLD